MIFINLGLLLFVKHFFLLAEASPLTQRVPLCIGIVQQSMSAEGVTLNESLIELNSLKESNRLRLTNLKIAVKCLVFEVLKNKNVFPAPDNACFDKLKKLARNVSTFQCACNGSY